MLQSVEKLKKIKLKIEIKITERHKSRQLSFMKNQKLMAHHKQDFEYCFYKLNINTRKKNKKSRIKNIQKY